SPNGWLRDKAQQMLVHRRDRAAVPRLEELARRSKEPLGRLHALCTLDGLGTLRPELLEKALLDPHPGVRRHAVRLCETPAARSPGVEEALVKLAAAPAPMVRVQLAYTLGCFDSAACAAALGRLLREGAKDPYLSAAALSSLNRKNVGRVVETVLAGPGDAPPTLTQQLLQSALGFGHMPAAAALVSRLAPPGGGRYRTAGPPNLGGFLDAL